MQGANERISFDNTYSVPVSVYRYSAHFGLNADYAYLLSWFYGHLFSTQRPFCQSCAYAGGSTSRLHIMDGRRTRHDGCGDPRGSWSQETSWMFQYSKRGWHLGHKICPPLPCNSNVFHLSVRSSNTGPYPHSASGFSSWFVQHQS